jgi:hypothetical protein
VSGKVSAGKILIIHLNLSLFLKLTGFAVLGISSQMKNVSADIAILHDDEFLIRAGMGRQFNIV